VNVDDSKAPDIFLRNWWEDADGKMVMDGTFWCGCADERYRHIAGYADTPQEAFDLFMEAVTSLGVWPWPSCAHPPEAPK